MGPGVSQRQELRLELHMIPRPDLELELLHDFEIARTVAEHSPFRHQPLTLRCVSTYLVGVTGDLVERSRPVEELRREFVVASALVLFARHLLNLEIDPEIVLNFEKTLRRSPYFMEEPLRLLFRSAQEEQVDSYLAGRLPQIELIEVTEAVLDDGKFKTSDRIRNRMELALSGVRSDLLRSYSRAGHFTLVGLNEVCFPLFGVRSRQHNQGIELREELKLRYGAFLMQVPLYLKKESSNC